MIHFLTQRFIENYDDYKNQKVRKIPNHFLKRIEEYGMES